MLEEYLSRHSFMAAGTCDIREVMGSERDSFWVVIMAIVTFSPIVHK